MNVESGTLMRLDDSGRLLADPDQDVRGRTVLDCDGHEIDTVVDLLIDPEQRKVRLLVVEHGGLFGVGAMPLLIPVETVCQVTDGVVRLDRTRVQVAEAPQYAPDLVDREEPLTDLYGYYGFTAFIPPPRGFFR
ncbi:PRC-barrel domain-containing protein [Actinoplanes sp. NPDC049802]|uniref:PRC-barrel domain-containing protein n=1 Tax=Actinoplanes sp. NPDC049802 TaxID=3154742 RepID=UPI0033D8784A